MKRGAVAANAGADDEQVVVERLGRGTVGGKRGGYRGGMREAASAEAEVVVEGSGSECLSPEAAETEIRRRESATGEGKRVAWSRNGGSVGRRE